MGAVILLFAAGALADSAPASGGQAAVEPPRPGAAVEETTTGAPPPHREGGSERANDAADVVVTARRRAERLVDVPVSLVQFGGEQLAAAGAVGAEAVALRTPDVRYGAVGDLKFGPTSIRGVYSETLSAGQDPAIGYYLDDVYIGGGVGAAIDYYDVDRLEVLRGPQGTLFGRNSVGGLINVRTSRPSFEWRGEAGAEYGNYDHIRLTGLLTGPVVGDAVALKVAGYFTDRRGYNRIVNLGRTTEDAHSGAVRAQLLFRPTEGQEWILGAEYREVDQASGGIETLRYGSPAVPIVAVLGLSGLPVNADPYDRRVLLNRVPAERFRGHIESLRGTIDVGSGLTLASVSAYRHHDYRSIKDSDRTLLDFVSDGDPERVDALQQELRLSSAQGGRFTWMVGGFYYHQVARNDGFVEAGRDLAILLPIPAGFRIGASARSRLDSSAAFASFEWDFAERWQLGVGGRYTYERKRIDYSQFDPTGLIGGTVAPRQAAKSWGAYTPSVSLRFKPSPDVSVYATVSRGFKSGGFNDAIGSGATFAFDPETLWNFEAGAKASFLGGRGFASLSAFHMRWSDIQIAQDDPATAAYDPRISNAGRAHSTGLEGELALRASDALSIRAAAAAVDARYDGGTIPSGSGVAAIPLRRIPFVPAFSASLAPEFGVAVGAHGRLVAAPELLVQGPLYLSRDQSPANRSDARVGTQALVNARLAYRLEGGTEVAVWGRNLGDATYKTSLFDLASQPVFGQKFVSLSAPRTYGASLRVSF